MDDRINENADAIADAITEAEILPEGEVEPLAECIEEEVCDEGEFEEVAAID